MNDTKKVTGLALDESFETRGRREWLVRLLVLLVAGMVFLPNLGAFGLWDPWETHYGEVTRNMVETHDWVSPWWGYRGKIGDPAKQGAPFFSKPILIFWTEATAAKVIGLSEWAIRLPMAIMAIMAVFMAYLAFSKVVSRRVGLAAAGVMMTCPQFFMLARQAQTDMPFVSTMTVAVLFFMMALFARRQRQSNRAFLVKVSAGLAVFLAAAISQYGIIATDLFSEKTFENLAGLPRLWALVVNNGIYHVAIYGVVTVILLVWILLPIIMHYRGNKTFTEEFKDQWTRNTYLLMFYVFAAYASLGKGLLGFMLPGAIIFIYLLITNEWAKLRFMFIGRGLVAFCLVGLPWYVAMFAKHGNAFYNRFFIHDHFNRLGTGVHEIDDGTFEHFLRWLGIGMFPWVAFIPLVLVVLAGIRIRRKERDNYLNLFVFIWFFVSYLLFTLASTKFHHYIFPALPPLAFLIGKFVAEHLSLRSLPLRVSLVVGIGIVAAVGWNIHRDPQALRNLFTYKYDRKLPDHMPLDPDGPTSDEEPKACGGDGDCRGNGACQDDGFCSHTWAHSQFFEHTTDSVRWLLTRDWLTYGKVVLVVILLMAGLLVLMLSWHRLQWPGFLMMGGGAFLFALWSLNYYYPSLSPHWSQKYVFEDYYDMCGDRLQILEQESYEPLIAKMGLDGLVDYFGATSKRVCPDNITAWLIVWRGETYYSYNELMPLEKKDKQLRPYLEEINPVMKTQPPECGGGQLLCPNRFYVFMENRSTNSESSIGSQVTNISKALKKDGKGGAKDAFKDVKSWEARKVSHENDFFTLFEVNPVYGDEDGGKGGKQGDKKSEESGSAGPVCGCATAHR